MRSASGTWRAVHRVAAPALRVQRGIIRDANERAQRLLGAGIAELRGRPLATLLRPWPAARRPGLDERGRHDPSASGGRHLARVMTPRNHWIEVEWQTLSSGPGGDLLMIQDLSGLRHRHVHLWRRHAELKLRGARQAADQERHRRHLAAMLHDHVQQSLAAAMLYTENARATVAPLQAEGAVSLDRAVHALRSALQATRHVVDELSPPSLGDLDLAGALNALADRLHAGTALQVDVDTSRGGETLGARADRLRSSVLYRVAEECLKGIGRQAPEGRVRVSLRALGATELALVVQTDDAQLDPADPRLTALGDWLRELHGRLSVLSPAQGGTRVAAHLDAVAGAFEPPDTVPDGMAALSLLHRLPMGLLEIDDDGHVAMMNPAAARLLLPVVHPRPLDNLFDALADALPQLPSCVRALQASGDAQARSVLDLPPLSRASGKAAALQLEIHRHPGRRLLLVVTEHAA